MGCIITFRLLSVSILATLYLKTLCLSFIRLKENFFNARRMEQGIQGILGVLVPDIS